MIELLSIKRNSKSLAPDIDDGERFRVGKEKLNKNKIDKVLGFNPSDH